MATTAKIGDPIDPTKPAGPKFGDPGHPLPSAKPGDKDEQPSGRAIGAKTSPESGWPQIGDVVTLKSGGPAMTVIDIDPAGGLAAPGSPATDVEITPERRASGQRSIAPASKGQGVLCQWFNPVDHTVSTQPFAASALVPVEGADKAAPAKPWTAPSK